MVTPVGVSFTDTHPSKNIFEGTITITKAAVETAFTAYAVAFSEFNHTVSATPFVKQAVRSSEGAASFAKTGADITVGY